MRRSVLVLLLPLSFLAAGCGGGGKPAAESARPCLEKLGTYVHHRPEKGPPADPTPRLPLLDPDNPPVPGQSARRLPWPDDFVEYGEVLYPPTNPGANSVQVFVFGDSELPTRIMDVVKQSSRGQLGFTFGSPVGLAPGTRLARVDQSLVLWSSAPSAHQRATVRHCLAST